MTINEIRTAVETRLPANYAPLTVSFYGSNAMAKDDFVIIGDDSAVDLCVDTRDNCLYAVDPEGKLPVRFVNSGIEQFIGFFNAWKEFSEKLESSGAMDAISYRKLKMTLRPGLTAIDARALGSIDKWWEPSVEQLEEDDE
jgi:hypothetical protein